MRRVLRLVVWGLSAWGLAACGRETPVTGPFCGIDTLRVPITVGAETYEELIIRPRRCP